MNKGPSKRLAIVAVFTLPLSLMHLSKGGYGLMTGFTLLVFFVSLSIITAWLKKEE